MEPKKLVIFVSITPFVDPVHLVPGLQWALNPT